MRIGLMHGEGPAQTVAATIDQIVEEEKDGFDTAWFGQIFTSDSLTLIALAARETSRIELATAVIPTYTRHPYAMAQQAVTVQDAANGRFTLGVGPSHHVVVEGMWGLSYAKPARHVREYLSVLLPLLREGRVSFSGDVYRVNAMLLQAERHPLPVIISALAPAMLRLAGAVADGTVTWLTGAKTVETHIVPSITAAAKDAGRPAPRVVVALPVCVHDDVAEARAAAARHWAMYAPLPNYQRVLAREGASGPADVAIVGNEAEVERQIRAVAAAGATDFIAPLFPAGPDAAASLRRSRDVVRSLVGKL